MATGGGPWTNMISDEIDVDAISLSSGFQWSLDDLGTQTKVAKAVPKRAGNYTHEEDIQLCISWENISTDPIIGNEQPGRAYWKRIADHYHANKSFESDRNANSLEHRWSTIHKECQKFQRYYDEVERLHPSGIPYKEHILAAQTLFAKGPLKKSFQFLHCWLKVRHCQKFQTIDNNRRSHSNMSSNGATEGDDGDDSGRSYSTEPNPNKRPIGKKQAKERLKTGADAGPYKEAIEELILDKKEEKKLREVRWEEEKKLKEERWKETKIIHQQKILLEKEKLMWEQG
ncbi:glutathione S-transferase T3-like [Panicum miliaceum]|uniref:Glutathione S-transferase T3-like n=1 Tax=Panicum miliaceum TaxID=4540 RepID=A0A3L6SX96_PANMI|nr:glutathione S-transferase T3-like [Panicum miliaceum]